MALAVIAVAVVVLALSTPLGLGRQTEERTYAVNVARGVLDSFRGQWQSRERFLAGDEAPLPSSLRFGCTVDEPNLTAFVYDEDFELVPVEKGAPHLRRVEVTVRCPRVERTTLVTEVGDPRPEMLKSNMGGHEDGGGE